MKQQSTEVSPLLLNASESNERSDTKEDREKCAELQAPFCIVAGCIALFCGFIALFSGSRPTRHNFPSTFVWGAATSSYQIEGATREDHRGLTVWDVFARNTTSSRILDHSTGDIACDHYHRMEQDVQKLMKEGLELPAYRFSIAWSRILPTGEGTVNPAGVDFYNRLIDTLLNNGIEPYATLFHWDTPQYLEEEYGGWMDARTVDAFEAYARIAFEAFGDRVKHWITVNEPWTVAVNGYSSGIHAPGHYSGTYHVAHNLLLAHAKAARTYRRDFQSQQGGVIGIANSGDFRYPKDSGNEADREAAERAMVFQFGWFVDPLFFGDYPQEMRDRLGDRLPAISAEERQLFLDGSCDFLGLNYYSSMLTSTPESEPEFNGYWADIFVDFHDDPSWRHNDMGWNVVPDGLREMLLWVSSRYKGPMIYVTENGSAEKEPGMEVSLQDENRRSYIEDHLRACSQAINEGVQLKGYFAWSLMDNFEWQFGYQRRFGIFHVDFETQTRTAKSSAIFFRETIAANGDNILV